MGRPPAETGNDPDKTHKSKCGTVFEALPPAKAPSKGKGAAVDEERKAAPKTKGPPPAPPVKSAPAAKDTPVAAEDVVTEEELLIAANKMRDEAEEEVIA
jgi:hypothetical protein